MSKKNLDAIPLTEILSDDNNENLNPSFSQNSISDSGDDSAPNVMRKKPGHGGRRSIRVNSQYISQKNRLSRYKNAVSNFMPFRINNNNNSELPVDSIGCFSNMSFLWVRKFLITHHDPLSDSLQNRKKYEIPVIPSFSDRADINGKRLLGIYKDEKQSRGKHGSMMRVAWKFCRTRIVISSFFYMLSILSALVAPVIFLRMTLETLEKESLSINNTMQSEHHELSNGTYDNSFKILEFSFKFYGRFDCILLMLSFAGCYFSSIIFQSITNWLNLRSAIRLRTAVLAASYRKVMKSSITNNISAHQVLTDDVDNMIALVDYLTKIFGTLVGIVMAFIASIVLLNGPGVWPLLTIIGYFCIPILLGKISTNRLRKSLHFLRIKMTTIEDFCINYRDIVIHNFTYNIIKQFYYCNSAQFAAIRNSKIFSVHIYGGVSSVMLGGLYLIWCDVDILTNNVEILVLLIVYIVFIKDIIGDYCSAIEAISVGKSSLESLNKSFSVLTTPDNSRSRTIDTRVLVSMTGCKFKWDDTVIFNFDLSRGEVLGVCGNHTKTLIYSLLGHSECTHGLFRQRGKIAFFPEEPFICIGSVKSNIIMGSDFDAKRYYTAITSVFLNEDVLHTLGADELPIETLDLNKQQRQRIALARAVYSDRDIYLFEQPFKTAIFSSNVLQMFANVIELVSSDPNKAIIICSTNHQILNICHKIYDTIENVIHSRSDFERISAVSYHEGSKHYSFESVKGANKNALTVFKLPNRFHVQIIHENAAADESTENLISKESQVGSFSMGIFNIVLLSLLTFINTLIYMILAIGFVMVVKKSYIDPWLNLVCLGLFVTTFFIELFQKVLLAKILEIKQKHFHKTIFEKIMKASLDYLVSTNIADILNWFSFTSYTQFQPYVVIIKSLLVLTTSVVLLILVNYWITSAVLLILITGQIISIRYIFNGRLKFTMNFYGLIEFESKKRLFSHLINNLRGRDVVQSFERVSEFCREFNTIIEENSTSIFLQRSVKHYVSFFLQFMIGINCAVIYLWTLVVGDLSIYNYLFSMFLYYLIMHHAKELIVNGYLDLITFQCKRKLMNQEIKSIPNNTQVSLLYEPSAGNDGQKGLSISIKDLVVKLSGRNVIEIKKLNIEQGEVIGISGNNSHLITAILFKLLKPTAGVIFLGNNELNLISMDNLYALISPIPYDLDVNVTIAEFLNQNETIPYKTMLNKIQEILPKILKLPNKLGEMVKVLSRKEKQLLCLIKSCLRKSMVIIIEFPDDEIQEVINLFIKKEFYLKTVIVIGTNHRHFEVCSRIVSLENRK